MKTFITIIAASAVLSASLVAGLAATDSEHAAPSRAATTVAAVVAPSMPVATASWVEPPAKAATACRDAAWPYRPVLCGDANGNAPRKVRVIGAGAPAIVQR